MNSVLHLFAYFVFILAATYGLWLLDLYMKFTFRVEDPNIDEDLYSSNDPKSE